MNKVRKQAPGVLEERLAAIGRWVDAVASLGTILDRNRDELSSAYFGVSKAYDALNTQSDKANALRGAVERALQLPVDARAATVADFRRLVDELSERLAEIKETCDSLSDNLVQVAGKMEDAKKSAARAYYQAVTFEVDVTNGIDKLTEQVITSAEKAIKLADASQTEEAWRELDSNSAPITRRLLGHYVDILGGISIRERGISMTGRLVNDLCNYSIELASGLASSFESRHRIVMTVPARDGSRFDELPIMSLGVGQWSLWGLPLIAHELGRATCESTIAEWIANCDTERYQAFAGPSQKVSAADSGLWVIACDAIAAWTLGPAYAAALIYLELNPCDAATRGLTDGDRAFALRTALKIAVDRSGAGSGVNDDVIVPLFRSWSSAIKAAGTQPPPVSRARELRHLVQDLLKHLSLHRAFSGAECAIAQEITDQPDIQHAETRVLKADVALRHVLNAGWFRRIQGVGTPDEIESWMARLADVRITASLDTSVKSGTVTDGSANLKNSQRISSGRAS